MERPLGRDPEGAREPSPEAFSTAPPERDLGERTGGVRVGELARELGVDTKTVLAKLRELGASVQSESSAVDAPAARRLRAELGYAARLRGETDATSGQAARAGRSPQDGVETPSGTVRATRDEQAVERARASAARALIAVNDRLGVCSEPWVFESAGLSPEAPRAGRPGRWRRLVRAVRGS